MASLSRGKPASEDAAPAAEGESSGSSISFPKFLNRQNNQ
jgi:hypothetical protein